MMSVETQETEVPKPLIEIEAFLGVHKRGYGVLLKVTSEPWEKLFKKLSGGKIVNWKKDGLEATLYEFPTNDAVFRDLQPSGRWLMGDEDAPPMRGGGVAPPIPLNLSFLRMEGLADGVEVFFPGVYESDVVRRYAQKAAERANALFKKLSPGSVRVKVFIDDWKEGSSFREVR